ncbi:glycosyltransferase [Neobacillus cucumis]|uniref:glycosyltransferase n=1 Tax=Neobacillus cucumis TaxID=1740721 RepID=UPI0028535D22|nr:glycosyltransferase [Neobacillus cucumis]MDR4944947.1 glycosyltransferase [Neobacillus cucumis]
MRIYFYNNYLYGRGGMETVVPMVCRSLIQRGHEVKIILINKSEFLDWSVGIPVIYIESEIEQNQWQNVNTNDIYGCTLILQKIFKKLPNPDVIVPLDIDSIIPARNASEVYANRPRIISWIHLSVKVLNRRENLKFADGHLSISKENVIEIRKIDEHGSIHLVYNPVSKKTKSIPRPAIANFIYLGRLSYGKRLDRILYALADISGDWTLQVIGEGDYGPNYKKMAEDLGINNRISWEGWKIKPWEAVREATALLLSSDFEGLPMCIMEAHAHGIPVIAGDCPSGPAEMIQNGINGWLYPYQDVIAFSSILEGVVQKEIALPSHELVEQTASDYDLEKVIDRVEQAFIQECKSNN